MSLMAESAGSVSPTLYWRVSGSAMRAAFATAFASGLCSVGAAAVRGVAGQPAGREIFPRLGTGLQPGSNLLLRPVAYLGGNHPDRPLAFENDPHTLVTANRWLFGFHRRQCIEKALAGKLSVPLPDSA